MQSDRNDKSLPKTNCNVLLEHSLSRIMKLPCLKAFRSAIQDGKLKFSADFNDIMHKVNAREYLNVDEFLTDLKRMKQKSFSYLLNDQLSRKAEQFFYSCEWDVKLMEGCSDCFSNEVTTETDDWFTEVCTKPHLVVMVKMNHCDLPAKVIGFDNKKVFVRIFEELTMADVPYKDCSMFPERNLPLSNTKGGRKLRKALAGANLYIGKIIEKYGHYNYGEPKAPLTAKTIAQHLRTLNSTPCTPTARYEGAKSPRNDQHTVAKRIKLENSNFGDYQVDTVSTQGNVDDGSIYVGDVSDEDDNAPLVVSSSTTTVVDIQKITTETSSRSSPPTLRECTSRCNFESSESELTFLRNDLEKLRRDHQFEISSMTKSCNEILKEMCRQHESELLKTVEETKTKQWCRNCWKEAKLYCCWQTSYCDNLCQRKHWPDHATACVNEQYSQQLNEEE